MIDPRIWPIRLAQVVEPHNDGSVSVILEDVHYLGELRVRCARIRAHPAAGDFRLPEVGDWGLVVFTRDDMRTGVWIAALDDYLRNLRPEEVWEEDVRADVMHHPGDQWGIAHGEGTTERHWPDGSHLRVSTTKDGTMSNTTLRGAVTKRMASRKIAPGTSERVEYFGADRPPVDVEFVHSSGAIVRITADGRFELHTPMGHRMEVRDGTEKIRDPETGEVTGTPEEDQQRVVSGVELRSEQGHQILLNDDPVRLEERFIRVRHPIGHEVLMHDDPIPLLNQFVRVKTAAGHLIEARDLPEDDMYLRVQTLAGHLVEARDTPEDDVYLRLRTVTGHLVEARDMPEDDVYLRLQTAGGHMVEARDMPEDDAYLLMRTAAGHQLEARDAPGGDQYVQATTIAGHALVLRDTPNLYASVVTPGGRELLLDDDNAVSRVADPVRIEVDAPAVALGDGAGHQPVARLGDAVQVNVVSGSSAGTYTGTITAGSGKVDAS